MKAGSLSRDAVRSVRDRWPSLASHPPDIYHWNRCRVHFPIDHCSRDHIRERDSVLLSEHHRGSNRASQQARTRIDSVTWRRTHLLHLQEHNRARYIRKSNTKKRFQADEEVDL